MLCCSYVIAGGLSLWSPLFAISPVNSNASSDARAVLDYIDNLSASSFNGVIAGQNLGHGTEIHQKYNDYVVKLHEQSGKWLGLIGVDYEYMKEYSLAELKEVNAVLKEYWAAGGLITINFTAISPWNNSVYDYSDRDLTQLVKSSGGHIYQKWKSKLDRIAAGLADLRDAGVVVLFRPMQEMSYNRFWYGKKGQDEYRSVWRHMYDYFTNEKDLNNLLWVFSPLGGGDDYGYPGDSYVDIVAGTSYSGELTIPGYDKAKSYNKPLGMGEWGFGINKSWGQNDSRHWLNRVKSDYPRIAFFVAWHNWGGSNQMSIVSNKNASQLMNSSGIITREDIANVVKRTVKPPSIIAHPSDVTVDEGMEARFSVTVSGTPPLSFQWERKDGGDWQAVWGANKDHCSFGATLDDDGAQLRVVVSNAEKSVVSSAATLTVNEILRAPQIQTHPSDREAGEGEQVRFTVEASGSSPLSYAWEKAEGAGWTAISGATNREYAFTAAAADDNTRFRVTVSNSQGSAVSNAATLTVLAAPAITAQPRDVTVTEGDRAIFSVEASGSAPLDYQWEKNEGGGWQSIGISSERHTIHMTSLNKNGNRFRVTVSNQVGSTVSAIATLTVAPKPERPAITQHPQYQTVAVGEQAVFAVEATGTEPLSYQWEKKPDGGVWNQVPGATASSFTILSVSHSDNNCRYRACVTNEGGAVTSAGALLTVTAEKAPPVIEAQPRNSTVFAGRKARFTVAVSGRTPMTFSWEKNSGASWSAVAGATQRTLTIEQTSLTDNGLRFRVTIANADGAITSAEATLTVKSESRAPQILSDLQDVTVLDGSPAVFKISAAGSLPLTYAWETNDGAGWRDHHATGASYTVSRTTSEHDNLRVRVTVSNAHGLVVSRTAVLTLTEISGPVIPGRIEAEDYAEGGEGVGYHDLDAQNQGGAFRDDGVDIRGCGDAGGGFEVFATESGEWLAYTMTAIQSGEYIVSARYSQGENSASMIRFFIDSVKVSGMRAEPTGGEDMYAVMRDTINAIQEGVRRLRVAFGGNGVNLNSISFEAIPNAAPAITNIPEQITVHTGEYTDWKAEAVDPDGDNVNFTWDETDAPSWCDMQPGGRIVFTAPHEQEDTSFAVTLIIDDGKFGIDSVVLPVSVLGKLAILTSSAPRCGRLRIAGMGSFAIGAHTATHVEIRSVNGRLLDRQAISANARGGIQHIRTSMRLSRGTYLIQIIGPEFELTRKAIFSGL